VAAVALRRPLEDLEDDLGHVVGDVADALAATAYDLAVRVEQVEPNGRTGVTTCPASMATRCWVQLWRVSSDFRRDSWRARLKYHTSFIQVMASVS
jgi:hypothetical protein